MSIHSNTLRAILKHPYTQLVAIFVPFSLINYLWLSYNTMPPDWDRSQHMILVFQYHGTIADFIVTSDYSGKAFANLFIQLLTDNRFHYLPLVPLMSSFIMFWVGGSERALALVNLPFLGILLFALYQVGRRIHSERAGILSGLLLLLYPIVFGLSRTFMLDIATLSMTALTFYFLLYSDELQNWSYTLLFGASFGVGLLTKPVFPTFIGVPIAFVTALVLLPMPSPDLWSWGRWRRLCRLLLAIGIGLSIAGLWYVPNAQRIIPTFGAISSMNNMEFAGFGADSMMYYVKAMIEHQTGPVFFGLLVYGAATLYRRVSKRYAWLLLLWLVGVYVFQTAVPIKDPRYSLGILVPVSLISAVGLSELHRRVIYLVLAFGLLQVASLSLPESLAANGAGILRWTGWYYHAQPPRQENWKIEEALQALGHRSIKVGVVSDHIFINGQTFGYYSLKLQLPFEVIKCRDHADDFIGALPTYDVVITKSDWVPPGGQRGNPFVQADVDGVLWQHFESNRHRFKLLRSFGLPDGSDLLVYGKRESGR